MKLRTQFTLAFVLLAVLPLAAIVLFTYVTSQRALRQEVAVEAESLTGEMEERMAAVRVDLARRVRRLGELPLRRAMVEGEGEQGSEREAVMGRILTELGEAAPFVTSLELAPRPVAAPPGLGDELAETVVVAPEGRSGLVIHLEEIVRQVEGQVMTELAEDGIDEDERRALEQARKGVAAAAAIVDGIARLAEVFAGDEQLELDLGELEVDLDGEGTDGAPGQLPERGAGPPQRPGPPVHPPPPAPAPPAPQPESGAESWVAWGRSLAEWDERWQRQQQEWEARYREWESEYAEAEREQHGGAPQRGAEGESRESGWEGGRAVYVPLREGGEVVGAVRARIAGEEVLRGVLARSRESESEVPFALDGGGNLFTLDAADRDRLERLPLEVSADGESASVPDDWVVATSRDPATGLTYGIARPIGKPLEAIRVAAARNFVYGLGLIGLALVGMRPLSRRMTRNLQRLNDGVERITRGDLGARVQVDSRSEIGQLARAFNRMATEVQEHQSRLVEEERRRRDQEVETKLLEAEYARKSEELEDARRFQLSLLPDELPEHPSFELAVHMRTATEVGGDYYDFRLADDGALVCAVGDATGHGARAGTMVTVIKSLFSAFPPEGAPSYFLTEASRAVRRMKLGRMAMALTVARLHEGRVELSAAGMPPALLHRAASGEIEELLVEGMPLGGLSATYRERDAELAPGDTLLLSSDGFAELPDAAGEPLGYTRVRRAFAAAAAAAPPEIVAALQRTAEEWAGPGPPNDDITFVVLRVR